jgi:phosphate transport system substrate-binding protein
LVLVLLGFGAAQAGQTLVIKGSNTFGEELGPRLIAVFEKAHPDFAVELEHKGTGTGLTALLAGECDIAAASRPANEDEERLARSRGIALDSRVIGYYGASVIVNAAIPVRALSDLEVRDIFTGATTNWNALHGPDAPIHLYIRDPSSGTYLGFRDLAMQGLSYAPSVKAFKSYAEIADAVNADPNGIGYVGVLLQLRDKVKLVSINGELPTPQSIGRGVYPYARELRLYVNAKKQSDPAKEFIKFVRSDTGQTVLTALGFVRYIEPKRWPAPSP